MGPFLMGDIINFGKMPGTSILTGLLKPGKVGRVSSIISSRCSFISTLLLTSVDKADLSET